MIECARAQTLLGTFYTKRKTPLLGSLKWLTEVGKSPWAKNRQANSAIKLQAIFDDYRNSDEHEVLVQSRSWSPPSPLVSDSEAQRSLFSTERISSIIGL